ncbi:MAG: hypothetical protein BAJALOKI1v1_210025 [Promethearchaeota archaeon]|nr:MAG: hypothetical protein BAJALOKI1v1_210025 [Candidatus Lokiarchaeota archaeon]
MPGLDKWIKEPEREEKEEKEEKEEIKEQKKDSVTNKQNTVLEASKKASEASTKIKTKPKQLKPQKFLLKCGKSKCNYQRILLKRVLTDQDTICPRCKGKMKIMKSS